MSASTTQHELAIRDLVARYIDAVNRYNAEDWAATWHRDARWDLMGTIVEGSEAILGLWKGAMGSFDAALMMLNSGTVAVDGESARGRWYVTEHLKPAEGDPNMTLGVYDDEYVLEDGQWLFSSRRYHVMYQGAPDMSGVINPYRP
ncbi:MAG: nuclear transport factor 2 family protein [Pseudomonadota bacterium]